jgi:hypothetical protein
MFLMGRPKLPAKLRRSALAFKVTSGERALLRRVAEAMGRELTLPANALGVSAAIRMMVQREAARLGVSTTTTEEGE